MNPLRFPSALQRVCLASVFLVAAGAVFAQTPPGTSAPPDPERAAEIAAAREELQRAQRELGVLAARVAELSVRHAGRDIERELAEGVLRRPMLGIVLQADAERGVRLASVNPLGPADEKGLRGGDRLLSIDGTPIEGATPQARLEHATALLRDLSEDQEVKFEVERSDRRLQIEVQARILHWPQPSLVGLYERALADRLRGRAAGQAFGVERLGPVALCPEDNEDCLRAAFSGLRGLRGLQMAPLNPQLGRYFGSDRGVLVLASNQAFDMLQAGDVILEIDGARVETPSDVVRALTQGTGDAGATRQVGLLRDRKRLAAELPLLQLGLPALPPFVAPPPAPPPARPPAAPAPPAAGVHPAAPRHLAP